MAAAFFGTGKSLKFSRWCLTTKHTYGQSSSCSTRQLSSSDADKKPPEGHTSSERADEEPKSKETDGSKKEAISKQLLQQILSMKISSTSNGTSELSLARPRGGERIRKVKEMFKLQEEAARRAPDLDPNLVAAVKDVASSLGGDSEKTESELLQKLRSHDTKRTETQTKMDVGDLFAGMKIDRSLPKRGIKEQIFDRKASVSDKILEESDKRLTPHVQNEKVSIRAKTEIPSRVSDSYRVMSQIDLFGAKPLNIFSQETATQDRAPLEVPELKTWDRLEQKEMQLLVTHPFKNAYEEMIMWTKQGRLWKFPIDNEQGLDEEAKVGFHKHVFLDHLIADFPKKGPIRHFMELVIVGLSKNPYLTVQQKREHINWFRNYFKDKEAILKEVGALG